MLEKASIILGILIFIPTYFKDFRVVKRSDKDIKKKFFIYTQRKQEKSISKKFEYIQPIYLFISKNIKRNYRKKIYEKIASI